MRSLIKQLLSKSTNFVHEESVSQQLWKNKYIIYQELFYKLQFNKKMVFLMARF